MSFPHAALNIYLPSFVEISCTGLYIQEDSRVEDSHSSLRPCLVHVSELLYLVTLKCSKQVILRYVERDIIFLYKLLFYFLYKLLLLRNNYILNLLKIEQCNAKTLLLFKIFAFASNLRCYLFVNYFIYELKN